MNKRTIRVQDEGSWRLRQGDNDAAHDLFKLWNCMQLYITVDVAT